MTQAILQTLTQSFGSLSFVFFVIVVVASIVLAFEVYKSDPTSATNRIFVFLSMSTVLWLTGIYAADFLARNFQALDLSLIARRLAIFFAAPLSALFFLLSHTIPSPSLTLKKGWLYLIAFSTIAVMGVALSPYAFTGIHLENGNPVLETGPGLLPFAVLSTIFSALAVYWLVRKFLRTTGVEKRQLELVLTGIAIMLTFITLTILLPIVFQRYLPFFNSLQFLSFAPLYALIFLGMTGYAITKYQLFHIKIIATEALIGVIWLVLFSRIYAEDSVSGQIIDGLILLFMVVFGVLLIRSVEREVRQRELIEEQKKELEESNARQESLIHFVTHQVKGFFTKSRDIFSMILEGEYGPVPPAMKTVIEEGFRSDTQGVTTVQEILNAANMKKGTFSYSMAPIDFKTVVREAVEKLKGTAEGKKLSFSFACGEGSFTILGDKEQLSHAVRNLIDNSVKYTPEGSVVVELACKRDSILLSIIDTGVGLSPEDKEKLFTEGGMGKDSRLINVDSTGYGLFIVRNIVEAHHGRVWAESAGRGKGSRFFVELPMVR